MTGSASGDRFSRRLATRLRVIKNGDDNVNALRSDISCVVASTKSEPEVIIPQGLPLAVAQASAHVMRPVRKERPDHALGRRPKLRTRTPARNAFVNVFIEFLRQPSQSDEKPIERVQRLIRQKMKNYGDIPATSVCTQNLLSATVPVTLLAELAQQESVSFIHASEPLKFAVPHSTKATKPTPRRVGGTSSHKNGEGVIIGIIDVGGFDFAHSDLLDAKQRTRFLSIWDQGGTFRKPPARFEYGSELTKTQMDAAIAASRRRGGLPAHILEPQSQMEEGSHATHVASIAAGKSGVCPKAMIVGVLIDVPNEETTFERRRSTFSDSSRIAHAVDYLIHVANGRPISINISLGTNGGSHDGASGVSRWIDATLYGPGRCVCIAAGNAGQEGPTTEDDFGWIMGRIHTKGQIPARGLDLDLEWVVIGDGIEDFSENELEIWYGAQDRLTVFLQPPGEEAWYKVEPRRYLENKRLKDGTTLSIYNEQYHPANGANYIAIYLSPNLEQDNLRGIRPGVWKVRLHGDEIRDGKFNAWIERDDPSDIGREGNRRLMRFPSFFSAKSNVDSHSVNSLACGRWVISVANLDVKQGKINITSSQGPTRDDRNKPDIAAPGTDIVAAKGFSSDGAGWISMSGTSMASPYVCGLVGLMLAVNPELTSAQCSGILQRTARPLPGSTYAWCNDAGFGQIDPEEAVKEARSFTTRTPID